MTFGPTLNRQFFTCKKCENQMRNSPSSDPAAAAAAAAPAPQRRRCRAGPPREGPLA